MLIIFATQTIKIAVVKPFYKSFIYEKNKDDAFQQFVLINRSFFHTYLQAILHFTTEDNYEEVYKKLTIIAEELDKIASTKTPEDDFDDVFDDIIGYRVQMIDLLASNLERNKRKWPL